VSTPRTSPIGPLEDQLWISEELYGASGAFTVSRAFIVDERLDFGALRCAIERVSDALDIRSARSDRVAGARDATLTGERASVEFRDWGPPTSLRDFLRLTTYQRMSLHDPNWLIVSRLVSDAGHGYQAMTFSFHHAYVDFHSVNAFFTLVGLAYDAPAVTGSGLVATILPHNGSLNDAPGASHALERLVASRTPRLQPFAGGTRPRRFSFAGADVRSQIDAGTAYMLRRAAVEAGVTLDSLLLALWCASLSRDCHSDEFLVGVVVSLRQREKEFGPLTAMVPFIGRRGHGLPVRDLVLYTQDELIACLEHRTTLGAAAGRISSQSGDLGRSPLVDAAYISEGASEVAWTLPEVSIREIHVPSPWARHDLSTTVVPQSDGGLNLRWTFYNAAVTRRDVVARVNDFNGYVESIREGGLERTSVVALSNLAISPSIRFTAGPVATSATIPEAINDRVRAAPKSIAVRAQQEQIAYDSLWSWANEIRSRLPVGNQSSSPIGILLGRGPSLLAAMIGVLQSGNHFVPLQPDWPIARIRLMCQQVGIENVISDAQSSSAVPSELGCVAVGDMPSPADSMQVTPTPCLVDRSENDLAYIMFTSGSSGVPKAVGVSHGSILRLVAAFQDRTQIPPGATWISYTDPVFDIFQLEWLSPLLFGGTIEFGVSADALHTEAAAGEGHVVVQVTPSRLRAMLTPNRLWPVVEAADVVVGGEVLDDELVSKLSAYNPTCRIWNAYGPTEATVWTSMAILGRKSEPVSIGCPLGGYRLYVLGAGLSPVAVGIDGELFIGGSGVANGYVNDPSGTALAFIADPWGVPGSRMYRTGDRVSLSHDGSFFFRGRMHDDELKVRGYRIALGEVETALRGNPDVRDAAVVDIETDQPGAITLAAFVIWETVANRDTTQLRRKLADVLPTYMVPSVIVSGSDLPLTSSGKCDRSAVRSLIEERMPGSDDRLASTGDINTRAIVKAAWREVLSGSDVASATNFFGAGGNSIAAARATAKVREGLGLDIPLRLIFETPDFDNYLDAITSMFGTHSTQEG
jgi:amino acid adenylation domain-containing protein